MDNPDHTRLAVTSIATRADRVKLQTGRTYLLEFDWRVLTTLDGSAVVRVASADNSTDYKIPGMITGEFGHGVLPVTVNGGADYKIVFELTVGGGKVVFDNVSLCEGGVGPWRRDFEAGFVLVNPLNRAYTFTAEEIAGAYHRIGVKRIRGSQVPEVNDGQPVSTLTLAPFDALVLLADRIAVANASTAVLLGVPAGGGAIRNSSAESQNISVGSANLDAEEGSINPLGFAIFGFEQNGTVISEAGVNALLPVRGGRIYVEVSGGANTGIALANREDKIANVSFYLSNSLGEQIQAGNVTIPPGGQIARFLDQSPFNAPQPFVGSLTFNSDSPIGALALRGLTNERSEFLVTTIPVAALNTSNTEPAYLPQIAAGGGWVTKVVLVNPTDKSLAGTLRIRRSSSGMVGGVLRIDDQATETKQYSIPPRGIQRFTVTGPEIPQAGAVWLTPDGSYTPEAVAIFSFRNNGVTVSEAGVLTATPAGAFRMYAERSAGIDTGVAVTNTSPAAETVNFELFTLSGRATSHRGTMILPPYGQIAQFLTQLPGFSSVPQPFRGVLRISTSSRTGIAVTGLRSRINQRGDFLIATIGVVTESTKTPSTLIFPHLAVGGGWSTRFILLGLRDRISAGILRFTDQTGAVLGLPLR